MQETALNIEPNIQQAFVEIVGRENLIDSEEGVGPYGIAAIPYNRKIKAVIKPASIKEIQAVVSLAAEYKISLYPISRGNNWGYGSALPVRENCLIVDLSRMNKIIEVNEELAYAVLEPGVTQGQLYNYLKEKGSRLQIDPSGAGPNTSILGNALERGYGIGLYGDHFAAVSGMEIVLGNGEILNTNFGQLEKVRSRGLYRYGQGPYLDGIFTQSNFGIITKITLWLQKAPEKYEIMCFGSDNENSIYTLTEIIRELLLDGAFSASCNLVSRNRALTTRMAYPWSDMHGTTPLSKDIAVKYAKKVGIKAWNGMAPIFGSSLQIKAAKSLIKKRLRGKVDKLIFLSETKMRYLNKFQNPLSKILPFNIKSLLTSINPLFEILRGNPTEISMRTPYWRNKNSDSFKENFHPARDGCGLIWITPLIPMREKDMRDFMTISGNIIRSFKFDFCPTFTAVSHRTFDCSLPILYDRENPKEKGAAAECYTALFEIFNKEGFTPYRLGIQSMQNSTMGRQLQQKTFHKTVGKIKAALDPAGIISPERYGI